MFSEDLAPYFNDFGVIAQHTPLGSAFSEVAKGLLTQPDEPIFSGMAANRRYQLRVPATAFATLKLGDLLVIAGRDYRVREIDQIGDGATQKITVEAV